MGKSSAPAQREISAEERRLLDTQSEYLKQMGDIAQKQFNLSEQDRTYYENVFRTGSDTEARTAIADLRSKITGTTVNPEDITSTNLDSLLRDLTLTSSTELKDVANKYISTANEAYQTYGAKATGLSDKFSSQIADYTKKYAEDIAKTQAETGTIRQNILSRETGAAQAGISSSYAEARKQMQADLARRGISSSSGVSAAQSATMYQQEALAKYGASAQARASALQLSEAQRQQELALSGQAYQTNLAGAQAQYQTESQNLANIYGIGSQLAAQNYNIGVGAAQQQISNLSALSAMGAGVYSGSQNYLSQAAGTYGSAAQISGQQASSIGSLNTQYSTAVMNAKATETAGLYSAIGTMAGMAAGGPMGAAAGAALFSPKTAGGATSDIRFKNNIILLTNINGVNIYTWEWNDFAKEYNVELYEPKGVIAQELIFIYPQFVMIDENGYYSVDYDGLYKEIGA